MNTDESIRFATKYLEDLLSFFGINVAVYSTIEDDVIQLSIPSTSMNSLLIGKNANNLRALQHVLMMTLIARNAEVTRVNIDIADYKRQRADKIERQAEQWVQEVSRTGKEKILDLNAAAQGQMTLMMPFMMLLIMISLPGALVFYYLLNNMITVVIQKIILNRNYTEMEAAADKKILKELKDAQEAVVVEDNTTEKKSTHYASSKNKQEEKLHITRISASNKKKRR